MNLFDLVFLLLLVAAFAGLVSYVRHDGFAARQYPYRYQDDLATRVPR
jgi:hypothetical protein